MQINRKPTIGTIIDRFCRLKIKALIKKGIITTGLMLRTNSLLFMKVTIEIRTRMTGGTITDKSSPDLIPLLTERV
jgi:hypothetical protein